MTEYMMKTDKNGKPRYYKSVGWQDEGHQPR